MKVRDVMQYPIHTVKPDVSVMDLMKTMSVEKEDAVLIAREGLLKKCEGIITKSQIYKRIFASEEDPENVKVSEFMISKPLVTINPNASCKEAAELMIKHNIQRLPVVEDGILVGMITSEDLLKSVVINSKD